MTEPTENPTYPGHGSATFDTSFFNAIAFCVRMMLGRMATATIIQVKAVFVPAELSSPGTVTIQPLVNQVDALGNSTPHGQIFNVPYFRLQGGANAVVLDPEVGDIGVAVFASRDISAVKAAKGPANPGSKRRFDYADGLYLGGFLNGTPTQYVMFTGTGINVVSPTKITLDAPVVEVDGDFRSTGAVIAGYGGDDQVGLQTHTHPDPQGGNTGSPNAGS